MTREPDNYSPCRNKATTAKGYCKLHDPDIKKAKSDARSKKWNDQWEAQEKAREASRVKQAELERKAALYDALESERVGEVVLGEGKIDWFANNCGGGSYGIKEYRHPLEKVNGQAGTLIFRPRIRRIRNE